MLAMLVQLAVIFSDYYWNVGELSRLFVEQETGRLASGVGDANGGVTYRLPEEIEQRYSNAKTGYIARIRDASGKVIFESCDDACESRFLPKEVNPPDFWLRTLIPGKPLTLVGGRAFFVGHQRIVVDVATMGDPQNVISEVFWNEILEHMIVPMSILLVLVLGATLLSVRRALKPVQAAANAADLIDPLDSMSHLPIQDMPREIAHLAVAVNRAFERVGELMKSQRVLTSGIAHEVRTPLAAIKLELGRIDHPRARKAEADLDDLVDFVSQLTALARLDSFDHGMFEEIDLAMLCSEVVTQLAPWVYENEHSLELSIQAHDVFVKAVPALLKDALRNLIENAVRHTPNGTNIVVRVGTKCVEVEDRVASVQQAPADPVYRSDGLGIGLKIVERIAELHKGSLRNTLTKHGHTFYLELARTEGR
ncbi:HAMP domain-containing histidine kinase [Rhizobium ruizarguesonis]|uniref:sensor histidine kinase n=1 Tax=Rhizobium ruizarguesonis TaxID=2081791 RepID=UPI000A11D08E|nr:HAMP domain-containing sensor histidine kinase [Rhizobium ruizarguesonis]MBY5833300.1 HAMP domain-containing histidine kinase [Rhizobium leguminosarum]QJS30549.1 HAMP domain-containing histidine kinase [Rhizobium leguminosarum bv. trifolii TA1]MBY5861793.1 HAMP domain-containing histidine kinase [Rhizobium leguminosarum]MBY5876027.1 HAMP domain-containing histidine kinase [Rhizobium leguminosarum]NEH65776.1 two-component sensor histidine kinase [Rhizobium ruizarguesonis]